jgi:hypothetical protein
MRKFTLSRNHGTDVIAVTDRGNGSFLLVRAVEGEVVQRKIEHHMTEEDIVRALVFSGYRPRHYRVR